MVGFKVGSSTRWWRGQEQAMDQGWAVRVLHDQRGTWATLQERQVWGVGCTGAVRLASDPGLCLDTHTPGGSERGPSLAQLNTISCLFLQIQFPCILGTSVAPVADDLPMTLPKKTLRHFSTGLYILCPLILFITQQGRNCHQHFAEECSQSFGAAVCLA